MWWLLLMESSVVRLGFFSFDICNKLLLNFCLKQIENNGPLINMIYKVLKNSAQGLLSSIHVRLLAAEMCSSHCFWKQQSMFTCFGFYRCLIVNSKAFCKIFFFLSLFFFYLYAVLWLTSVWFHFIMFWKWLYQVVTPMCNSHNVKAC